MKKCRVETNKDKIAEYMIDESRITGFSQEVAFPADSSEISAYLKEADDTGVTVQGARTGLNGGAVPFGGKTINLENCNQILGMRYDQEADRYYLQVQTGITLEHLNKLISTKVFATGEWDAESQAAYDLFRQDGEFFFPPDPTETTASIGGMISCNASGAGSYHYGAIRSYVEAVTIILSDGEVIRLRRGQHVAEEGVINITLKGRPYQLQIPQYHYSNRKNAVCYYARDDMDLVDLFIGAEGTLGVIAEAWLTLIRRPQECWGILSFYQNDQELKPFLHFLRSISKDNEAYIAAIEFFDQTSLRLIKDKAYSLDKYSQIPVINQDYGAALYYEIHSRSEAAALDLLQQSFECLSESTSYPEEAVAAMTASELQRLKAFRHAAPECANMVTDQYRRSDPALTAIFTDIATPEHDFFELLSIYKKTMNEMQISYIIYGHIGDWHLHVNMLPKTAAEYGICIEIYDEWAKWAAERGGTISAEHGVGRLKAGMLQYMVGTADMERCRIIKHFFDRKGILNQGVLFNQL